MAGSGWPRRRAAAISVLRSKHAMVMGPTPPGTGVMAAARFAARPRARFPDYSLARAHVAPAPTRGLAEPQLTARCPSQSGERARLHLGSPRGAARAFVIFPADSGARRCGHWSAQALTTPSRPRQTTTGWPSTLVPVRAPGSTPPHKETGIMS